MTVWRIDTFCINGCGGNPAGVVYCDEFPAVNRMQSIAQEAGYSETVFVRKNAGGFRLRYFTPLSEVAMCGHATLAAIRCLYDKSMIGCNETVSLHTNKEIVQGYLACIGSDAYIKMGRPAIGKELESREIADCIGVGTDKMVISRPVVVCAGLPDIIAGVRNNLILRSLQPDFGRITRLSEKYAVTGIHLYSEEGVAARKIQVRNFAPLVGINEESATGTANTSVAFLLSQKNGGRICETQNYMFQQGMYMGAASEIRVQVKENRNDELEIWLGGQTVVIGEKRRNL